MNQCLKCRLIFDKDPNFCSICGSTTVPLDEDGPEEQTAELHRPGKNPDSHKTRQMGRSDLLPRAKATRAEPRAGADDEEDNTAPDATPEPEGVAADPQQAGRGKRRWAIAGLSVACVAVLACAVAVGYALGRRAGRAETDSTAFQTLLSRDARLAQKFDDLNKELKSRNEELSALSAKVDEISANNKQLAVSNAQLTASNKQLTAGNKELNNNNEQLAESNRQLAESNQQLAESNRVLQGEVAALRRTVGGQSAGNRGKPRPPVSRPVSNPPRDRGRTRQRRAGNAPRAPGYVSRKGVVASYGTNRVVARGGNKGRE